MGGIASVSQSELGQRRKQLRRHRQTRFLRLCWQTLAVTGLTATIVWAVSQPAWVIYQPEQIKIEGNQFLTPETIRSLLPIEYPQSLLRLQPEVIAQKLETDTPIVKATVNRHLFPPGLTVYVKERKPVAIAQLREESTAKSQTSTSENTNMGVLDDSGWWSPLKNYTALKQKVPLPSLKVIGNPNDYQKDWPEFYQLISNSPVNIEQINWENPSNIILKTEIGIVHIGPYNHKLTEQLHIIDRMRQLPSHERYSQIAYIDLKNPGSPKIKLVSGKAKAGDGAKHPQSP